MDSRIHKLKYSAKLISLFYVPLFLVVFFIVPFCLRFFNVDFYNKNLLAVVGIVFFGNVFLAIFTQISNYIIEAYNIEGKTRDYLYRNFTDCFYRGSAGFLEIILYTISFSLHLESLVAGYLLLKTVSIWQDKDNFNSKKEGLHTAILRIAIVVSLLIALGASYYLRKFINN